MTESSFLMSGIDRDVFVHTNAINICGKGENICENGGWLSSWRQSVLFVLQAVALTETGAKKKENW